MLKSIFGSEIRGKILLFIYTHGESYPTEIARALGCYVNSIQNQLANLERDGVLYSRLKGTVRLFGINPRYPFKKELIAFLEKGLIFIPQEERERLYRPRLRPRQSGKPL
jgi:predicted transcriptional regulator with HTH domain